MSSGLCKYKSVFGEPGKGPHSYRIFNIAIVDVLFTILFAWLISLVFNTTTFIYNLIILFLLGIIMHRMFCVRTTIDKLIFG
jgi:hypothetical protein